MAIKIGHRGACGYEPENTLLSFKKAMELNVDMIELDVHVCKSKGVVVMHDDDVDRTTNGQGYIKEKTLDELKTLDAGKGERVPTLEEVFKLVNRKTKINIELKGPKTAKPVYELIRKYLKNGWSYKDFIISSFDLPVILEFNKLNPKVKTGIIIGKAQNNLKEFLAKLNTYSIHFPFSYINKEIVDYIHKKGMYVFAWTVNLKKDIQRMKKIGVDGIFSDFPDRI